jgi:hypothetical protein
MLFALFRIPFLAFPAVGAAGFAFGLMVNADHKVCPGLVQQRQTDLTLQREEERLRMAEQGRESLINVCQGIQRINAAMLTPQCKQVLAAPIDLHPPTQRGSP